MINKITLSLLFLLSTLTISTASAGQNTVLVQSTTSTANSGLYDYLLPLFESETGITVNVVAVGTGQAIRNATNCDADVLLVHAKDAELEFVNEGYGIERHDLMYNDFVLVGPADDPADIEGMQVVTDALQAIADSKTLFASRGDNSGTHKKEVRLWQQTSIDPEDYSGRWYRETGSGMGATLNIGTQMGAYILTDRATWIAFGNKGNFKVVVEGDKRLFNQYGITLVNAEKHSNVKAELGQIFIDWVLSDEGQSAIAAYSVDGQQLFFPNAKLN